MPTSVSLRLPSPQKRANHFHLINKQFRYLVPLGQATYTLEGKKCHVLS